MDSQEFRTRGAEMIQYVADLKDNLKDRRVTPTIEPGYLRELLPTSAPTKGEDWTAIMDDVEKKIMPGMTHWQHPRFHAFFPAGNSYPSILGDLLAAGLGCIGFSWAASPACTELETIVLDWMGKMVGLPDSFLTFAENSKGGGVIQGSASECIFVSMLAARAYTLRKLKKELPLEEEGVLMSKLIAYCSKEAHSCAEKGALMAAVKLRILEPDEADFGLRGETLRKAMADDKAMGLIPFYVEATLGTTSSCAFDALDEIGPLCDEFGVWLHVDGAYGGNSFICPELRGPMRGIKHASSFNLNPNKFMLTNFDCSAMWVKDRFHFTQALVVDPIYLQHSYSEKTIDYRHWGIPLSRRFRALKLWFVIRSYGVEGLQKYIREHCRLAKRFEDHVRKDPHFEISAPVHLGLVCFRLKGENEASRQLLADINASGKLFMVPASLNNKFVIRFCVCAENATDHDIDLAWDIIQQFASATTQKSQELPCENGVEEAKTTVEEEAAKENAGKKDKRSFFVRTVSSNKLYNPKIVPGSRSARRSSVGPNDNDVEIISPAVFSKEDLFWPTPETQNIKKLEKKVSDLSEKFSLYSKVLEQAKQKEERQRGLSIAEETSRDLI
ncbi:aromatic-L-amino-acid decarboxylase-like [Oratosquilla oratoria]|uniref:aromatic-L-amino-acid decarboxylase-like n=1 Tax=Oratosquilla oratoria TaxID=337810 RepID=UPI003F769B1C